MTTTKDKINKTSFPNNFGKCYPPETTKGDRNKLRTNGLHIEVASDECIEGKFGVSLNIICNRYDLMFGKIQFLKIKEFPNLFIPFCIHRSVCHVGLYLLEIKQQHFYEILSYLKHRFFWVYKFRISNALHNFVGARVWNNYILDFPDSFDTYLKSLSHLTARTVKKEARRIARDLNPEIKELHNIDVEFVRQYFAIKDLRANRYKNAPEFLRTMHPTLAFVMTINQKVAAITMVSLLDTKVAYAVGWTFDVQYSKYSIGKYLYLYTLKELLNRGVKRLILCGGNYEYKRIYKAVSHTVYNGDVRNVNPFSLLNRFIDLPFLVAGRIYRSMKL